MKKNNFLTKVASWFKVRSRKNNSLTSPNYILTKYNEIQYATSDNGVSNVNTVVTVNGKKVFDDGNLLKFLELKNFVQVSKNTIVNLNYVTGRTNWSVLYLNEISFNISPTYREEFKKALQEML